MLKLTVVSQPDPVFFKGQGGQKAALIAVVRLDVDANSALIQQVGKESIPLTFKLQNEDGTFVPQEKLDKYLSFPCQRPGVPVEINVRLLHAKIPFRINKCSAKFGGKYRLHIGLALDDDEKKGCAQQVAVTNPIAVKSKNSNAKERRRQIALQHHSRVRNLVSSDGLVFLDPVAHPGSAKPFQLKILRNPDKIYYKDDGKYRGCLTLDLGYSGTVSTDLFQLATTSGILELDVYLRITPTTPDGTKQSRMVRSQDMCEYISFPEPQHQPRIDLKCTKESTSIHFKLRRCSRRAGGTYALLVGLPGQPLSEMVSTSEIFVKSKSAWRELELLVQTAANSKRLAMIDCPDLSPAARSATKTCSKMVVTSRQLRANQTHGSALAELKIRKFSQASSKESTVSSRSSKSTASLDDPSKQNEEPSNIFAACPQPIAHNQSVTFPWTGNIGDTCKTHQLATLKPSFQFLSRMFISNLIHQNSVNIVDLAASFWNCKPDSDHGREAVEYLQLWFQGRMQDIDLVLAAGEKVCSWYEVSRPDSYPSLLSLLRKEVSCCMPKTNSSAKHNGGPQPTIALPDACMTPVKAKPCECASNDSVEPQKGGGLACTEGAPQCSASSRCAQRLAARVQATSVVPLDPRGSSGSEAVTSEPRDEGQEGILEGLRRMRPSTLCCNSPAGHLRQQIYLVLQDCSLSLRQLAVDELRLSSEHCIIRWAEMAAVADQECNRAGELVLKWASVRSPILKQMCYRDISSGTVCVSKN